VVKETALRRTVYAGAGLVIRVAALLAFVVIPRLAMHPEATADGVDRSSKVFFIIQLMAAAVLLAFIIRSRQEDQGVAVSCGDRGNFAGLHLV